MPLPTPDKKDGIVSRLFFLPPDLSPYFQGAILALANVQVWEQLGDRTPLECASIFAELQETMYNPFIGSIFPTIGTLPAGCLWMDGTTYAKEDYPALYAALDNQFKDANGFTLPDLTDRFLMGGDNPGAVGGEATHTLTVEEMPSHTHGGHMHLPLEASGELPTPLPDIELPWPSGSAGGDQPHNNIPPFFTVRYYVVSQ